ncbi:MAG TPA: right-handed parallel beta-helix repeat-containing protein, partial [Candidatus Polarisedimenticolia bacterium]|nr:right-handed parallel beta-helix repeat-containing protein [Candidatus Polarisedimenticolia bacterium]
MYGSISSRVRLRHATLLVAVAAVLAMWGSSESLSTGPYYVDGSNPSCSDTGPGTPAIPYCTIAEAARVRGGPGVIIEVLPGRYPEQVTVPASGAPGNHFVIQAQPGAMLDGANDLSDPAAWAPFSGTVWLAASVDWVPRQVFVDGARLSASTDDPSLLAPGSFRHVAGQGLYVNLGGDSPGVHQTFVGRRSNGFRLTGRSWVVIDGFEVTRTEDNGIYMLSGASNDVVTGNTVSLAGAGGIVANNTSLILIEGNTVSGSISHGIYVLNGTADSTVRGNRSSDNMRLTGVGTNGIKVENGVRVLVERNETFENQDTGIQINSSTDCVSTSNRSWNNGDHGFDHLNGSGTMHVGDVAFNNRNDGFSFEGGCIDSSLYNSIAVDNGLITGRYDLLVDSTCTTGFLSDYNIFWKSTPQAIIRYNVTNYTSLSAFAAATGQDSHSTQSDPLFADPAASDFSLQPASPAIDAGDSTFAPYTETDAEGKARVDDPNTPNTGAGPVEFMDRGALEFHGHCNGGAGPVAETCDGLDNDCDGVPDDGFDVGMACTVGLGECAAGGTVVCALDGLSSFCDATPGTPGTETCDGLDNDCDGTVDNGFGAGEACSAGVGECQESGVTVCTPDGTGTQCGATPGDPVAETCDGLDNDCDGAVDNGFLLGEACSAGVGECQASGVTVCTVDGTGTQCGATPGDPVAETCDGLDNDCDGAADNGFPVGGACSAGTGECQAAGSLVCSQDGTGTVCDATPGDPAAETCDGLDNDCDGAADNGFPVGGACSAGTGECQAAGSLICSLDGTGTVCDATPGDPVAETCDGLDNDCDGVVDNGFPVGGACSAGTGECQAAGSLICSLDGTGTVCDATPGDPVAETCDGLDNDCDGAVDNGFPVGGACSAGTGECQAAGSLICSLDGTGTVCNATPGDPATETCDGLDNDCDGAVDNGFPVGGACSAGTGECQAAGSLVCSQDGTGTVCDATPGDPAAETCDGLDNDCDGAADN